MFHIFHGPDEFSAQEAIVPFKTGLGDGAAIDLNYTGLDGKTTTLTDIMRHAGAVPFLAAYRLVVVRNYLLQLSGAGGKSHVKALSNFLTRLPETTRLIFWETATLKKSHPILKLGQTIPQCVRLFDTTGPHMLSKWVQKRVKQKGGQIDYRAVMALVNVVGDDLRALDNEIEKLTLYVNGARAVSLADVERLCPYTADSETFAMANAIGRQDVKTALDQLHKRLEEGQHPLMIMGGITGQFRGLLEIKSMAAAGLTPAEIAKAKGWKSDYAVKMRLKDARNFSLERLLEIFTILLNTDKAIKTGQIEETLAVDLLVMRLCRPH